MWASSWYCSDHHKVNEAINYSIHLLQNYIIPITKKELTSCFSIYCYFVFPSPSPWIAVIAFASSVKQVGLTNKTCGLPGAQLHNKVGAPQGTAAPRQ